MGGNVRTVIKLLNSGIVEDLLCLVSANSLLLSLEQNVLQFCSFRKHPQGDPFS